MIERLVSSFVPDLNGLPMLLDELRSIRENLNNLNETISTQPYSEESRVQLIALRSVLGTPILFSTAREDIIIIRMFATALISGFYSLRVGADQQSLNFRLTASDPLWVVDGADAPVYVARGLTFGMDRPAFASATMFTAMWIKPIRRLGKENA